jgi:transcriptional regulator with XRE-family HTH domain
MHSRKKTPVAVLRLMLGLTVEQFAGLIGKSTSAVTSLETRRLALSEETAFRISRETGVSVVWLLNGNAKQKPYVSHENGSIEPYTRETFERIQAQKLGSKDGARSKSGGSLDRAIMIITDWLSVYFHAGKRGEADLAEYLMRQFLADLVERLGKDDEGFMRENAKAGITNAKAQGRSFIQLGESITLGFPSREPPPAKS